MAEVCLEATISGDFPKASPIDSNAKTFADLKDFAPSNPKPALPVHSKIKSSFLFIYQNQVLPMVLNRLTRSVFKIGQSPNKE